MYDILKNIWKTPTSTFTPIPFWFWNDEIEKDELVRQINEMHKKGVDGFVIHPRLGMTSPEYLSDAYFDLVEAAAEAAKKRRMMVALYDEAMYPSGSCRGEVVKSNPKLATRLLYPLPLDQEVPEGEDILYRVWLRFDEDGFLAETSLDEKKDGGFVGYNLVLGYTGGTIRGLLPDEDDGQPNAPLAADLLNPVAAETFIELTHEKYYNRLSPYFASTIIGIFTDEPSLTGRCPKRTDGISWSYGTLEDFFACGGEIDNLCALLFPVKTPKQRREAEYIYRCTIRSAIGKNYYKPLSDWCRNHGIALMGHPADSCDCDVMKYFDIPGQDLVWRMVEEGEELTSNDSPLVKCAADYARHNGIARCSVEVFGACGKADNPWDFTPDEMMWYLNFLFARGCNLVIPHAFYYSLRTSVQSNDRPPDVGMNSVLWDDYKKLSAYIKRMSWLNSTGTNNPDACVLCSSEHMPRATVENLYKKGYTFNYLTLDDLMNRAHIEAGKICIDRYKYSVLLIDPRLRLSSEHVIKIGHFVTGGGLMYRGNAFGVFMEKNVKKTSYFDGETGGRLRFVHLTKSGCPFFVMINEGNEEITGRLVTDLSCAAADFDPMTGDVRDLCGVMAEGGFAYDVKIPAHCAKVIGMDPASLPNIATGEKNEQSLCEICSLSEGRMTFAYSKEHADRVILSAVDVHDIASVKVNGEDCGKFIFKPYEIDITERLAEGENTVEITAIPGKANIYGNPTKSGVDGVTVRMYKCV